MKCNNIFVVILLLGLSQIHSYAHEDDSDGDIIEDQTTNGKNPRAPSKRNVTISYENGMLGITFREPEGMATVEIKNLSTGISLMYAFDSALGFRCALAQYPASYKVTVKTNKAVYEETL